MLYFLLFISVAFAYRAWVLSDSHFDNNYVVGAPSECMEFDCCRADSRPKKGKEDALSGQCADYNCHAPVGIFSSALDYIATHVEKDDIVFWLMDTYTFDVAKQTEESTKNNVKIQSDLLKEKLPGIKVYPTPGNHDISKVNFWKYPPQSAWMLDFMSEQFKGWLSSEAYETFKYGGYYTELLHPGLRLITFLGAYFELDNIYGFKYDPITNDPGNMTQWINQTLALARANGERVLFMSHECMGVKAQGFDELYSKFNQAFYEMMKEYSDIVISHLCGHAHYDSVRVYPDVENPVFASLMFPAMTSKYNLDPRFKLMTFEKSSVKQLDTYVLDVEQCNKDNLHNWTFEYNTKEEYGLRELTVNTIKRFFTTLRYDDGVWAKFMSHYGEHGGKDCVDQCRSDLLCTMSSLYENQYRECKKKYY